MRKALTVALLTISIVLSAASLGIVFPRDKDGDAPVNELAVDDICGAAYQDPYSNQSLCYDLRCDATLTQHTTPSGGEPSTLEGTYEVYSSDGESHISIDVEDPAWNVDGVLQKAEAGIYIDGVYFRQNEQCG